MIKAFSESNSPQGRFHQSIYYNFNIQLVTYERHLTLNCKGYVEYSSIRKTI